MIFEKKIVGIYKGVIRERIDPTGDVFYYDYTDFDGLSAEGISFLGRKGQRLVGNIYFRGAKCKEKLVILDHGMGPGHRSYMREIDVLTQHGYTVLTYDHTGCANSEGEDIGGFAQSLSDLDCCLNFVKGREDFAGARIRVIGHSWGGFSTMNIPALHPEITHIVAMSGFISVRAILSQFFVGPLKLYIPAVIKLEEERNPDYASFDATESIKKTNTKALYIHSRDDKTVNVRHHFDKLNMALKDRPNTVFLELNGKNHNPSYTESAVRLLDERKNRMVKFRKKYKTPTDEQKAAFVASFDWNAMTEQDMSVWDKIFAFLDN